MCCELRANPNRMAKGVIIEAKLDKARGPLATVLLQNGTLHVGDNVVAGLASGRVRAMVNDKGERVKSAGPSMPVEISGLYRCAQCGRRNDGRGRRPSGPSGGGGAPRQAEGRPGELPPPRCRWTICSAASTRAR